MEQTTNSQEQGKDAKKVQEGFKNTLSKVKAIIGSETIKLPSKIKQDEVSDLVAELFKEESEQTRKETKESLKSLLKNYVVLEQTLATEIKKLENLEIAKKKEFNTAAQQLFNKIEGIDAIHNEYKRALTATQDTELDETPEVEETEE